MKSLGKLYIGTSNIVVPGNKSSFPESFQKKSRLHYYGTLFNSVELNITFYKTPMASTFQKWADEVPEDFRFSIKLSKAITHAKDLKFNKKDINQLLKNANLIGDKKGTLLLQFPSKINFDYFNKVEEILDRISQSEFKSQWQIAVEFRNADWYTGETFDLLQEHEAALVMHDFPKKNNNVPGKYTQVIFLRFHGPTGNYRGSYSTDFLIKTNQTIQYWLKKSSAVYVYFNNTAGDAYANAITLKTLAGNNSLVHT